jgi:hypothetical protein
MALQMWLEVCDQNVGIFGQTEICWSTTAAQLFANEVMSLEHRLIIGCKSFSPNKKAGTATLAKPFVSMNQVVCRNVQSHSCCIQREFASRIKNIERASYNGSIEASQASDVGSIPIARSNKTNYLTVPLRCYSCSIWLQLKVLCDLFHWNFALLQSGDTSCSVSYLLTNQRG